MWLLFHRKAGTKAVVGGRTMVEQCPSCNRRARFHEVEVTESYGVWFVDVVGERERKFKCDSCGDVFDVKDPTPATPAPKAGVDRVEELAAEQRKRDAARAKIEAKLDDELAALKKKMGR